MLFAAIGTGIAAALVVNGAGYNGAHGAAGELGHIIVRPGGAPCPCGQNGCLEAIASARAIGTRYAELSGATGSTAFDVVSLINSDKMASQVWHEAINALADGLITAQALFDVGVLVLGGGLAEAGDTLLIPLTKEMESRVTFHRMPKIVKAALGDTAGCKGAALLALDHLEHTA